MIIVYSIDMLLQLSWRRKAELGQTWSGLTCEQQVCVVYDVAREDEGAEEGVNHLPDGPRLEEQLDETPDDEGEQ